MIIFKTDLMTSLGSQPSRVITELAPSDQFLLKTEFFMKTLAEFAAWITPLCPIDPFSSKVPSSIDRTVAVSTKKTPPS